MSYDLFFYSRDKNKDISFDELIEHFKNRPNYEVNKNQAFYSNDATGIYFGFEYTSEEDSLTANGIKLLPIYFNVNFYRSHIFGLEAEKELTAFVNDFNVMVNDPQYEGMGNGEYSPNGFIKGWNIGNEAAYKSLSSKRKDKAFTLPAQQMEQYWKWNYDRKLFEKELQNDIFIPKYMFFVLDGILKPAIVWTDGIPITLVDVETIVMYRKELAPGKINKKPDFAVTTKQALEPFLSEYTIHERYVKYYFLNYDYGKRPKEIISFIRNLKPYPIDLIRLGTDQILDKEIFEKYT